MCLLTSSSSFSSSFSLAAKLALRMSNYLVTEFFSLPCFSLVSLMALKKLSLSLVIPPCASPMRVTKSRYYPLTCEMAFLMSLTSWSLCEPIFKLSGTMNGTLGTYIGPAAETVVADLLLGVFFAVVGDLFGGSRG